MSEPVKIYSQSSEDLPILSALMQDAVIRVGDMAFDSDRKLFVLIANRYRWEKKRRFFGPRRGERVRTALQINYIAGAKFKNLSLADEDRFLELLTITEESSEKGCNILLTFADDTVIRLAAECVDMVLSDLGDPWEATGRPNHD